jgi:hypothetical protein
VTTLQAGVEEQLVFNYEILEQETREVVQQQAAAIKNLMRRAVQDIIEIGQKLISVKAQLPHGQFGPWLRAEFEWSDQTALNFMNVARRFGQIPNGLDFAPKALYLLSTSSVPEVARQEAMDRAEAGEQINTSVARQIIRHHTHSDAGGEDRDRGQEADVANLQQKDPTEAPILKVQILPGSSAEQPKSETVEPGVGYQRSSSTTAHARQVLTSSKTDEHYTPDWIWRGALEVFDVEIFDLDPCSNSHENPHVPARQVFTIQDDGLAQAWSAKTLWMNHPYSESAAWIEKLCSEHESGRTRQAIALIKVDTSTHWFRRLRMFPICFLHRRVIFVNNNDAATFASALVCLGSDLSRFSKVFSPHGDIWTWLNTSRSNSGT